MVRFTVWVGMVIGVVTIGLVIAITLNSPETVTIDQVTESINAGLVHTIRLKTIGDDRRLEVEYVDEGGYKVVKDVDVADEDFIPYLESNGADPVRLQFLTLSFESESWLRALIRRYTPAWGFALTASAISALGIGAFSTYQSILDDVEHTTEAARELPADEF